MVMAYPVRRSMPWRGDLIERWEGAVKIINIRGLQVAIREDNGRVFGKLIRNGKIGKESELEGPNG